MKKIIATLLVVATVFTLSCNNSESDKNGLENIEASQITEEMFEYKADGVTVTEDSVIFTNYFGEKQTVRKNYERVVSLYPSYISLWYEAGGTLMGRTDFSGIENQIPKEALLESVKIVASGIAGGSVSIENIIESSPDLVILGVPMGQIELAEPFKVANVDTIVVDYNNLADYLMWYKIFCNINNKPELYDSVAKKTLEKVVQVLNKVPSEGGPKVLSLFAKFGMVDANLSGTTIGATLDAMGAINIADAWDNPNAASRLQINIETILLEDPAIIVIQQPTDIEGARTIDEVYGNNPLWKELSAVKNGQVYYLDPNLFHYKPHSRYSENYETLFKILYPNITLTNN